MYIYIYTRPDRARQQIYRHLDVIVVVRCVFIVGICCSRASLSLCYYVSVILCLVMKRRPPLMWMSSCASGLLI